MANSRTTTANYASQYLNSNFIQCQQCTMKLSYMKFIEHQITVHGGRCVEVKAVKQVETGRQRSGSNSEKAKPIAKFRKKNIDPLNPPEPEKPYQYKCPNCGSGSKTKAQQESHNNTCFYCHGCDDYKNRYRHKNCKGPSKLRSIQHKCNICYTWVSNIRRHYREDHFHHRVDLKSLPRRGGKKCTSKA